MKRLAWAFAFCCLVMATPVWAGTWIVRQDGGGDFLDIASAIGAAAPGDWIEIWPGTYPEPLVISKNLGLYSTSGPGVTILDGQQSHRILWVTGSAVCSLAGLQFYHGSSNDGENGQGGAIHVDSGSRLTVENCHFLDNFSSWDGGAVYTRQSGTQADFANCRFERNTASWNGGACGISLYSRGGFSDCTFLDNTTGMICGGVAGYYATLGISNCLFVRNRGLAAGAIRALACTVVCRNNTIHGNSSRDHGSVLYEGPVMGSAFEFNIVTSDDVGAGFALEGSCAHTCNILYGNPGGDIIAAAPDPSELFVDPAFCDYPADDFQVCFLSVALPENNGCGLIGAFGAGCDDCGPVGTEDMSWGEFKKAYR